MTKENKDLLLKYLCMALPYEVICYIFRVDDYGVGWRDERLTGYFFDGFSHEFYFGESPMSVDNILKIKPYLRPMSSMTEEERDEIEEISHGWFWINEDGEIFPMGRFTDSGEFEDAILPTFKYFLENHFDFMGLIHKNLAIEVTENNNPYK